MKTIHIYGGFIYPDGEAASERIKSIKYAFEQNGYNVIVYSTYSYYDSSNKQANHHFLSSINITSKKSLMFKFKHFYMSFLLAKKIKGSIKNDDIIFFYGRSYLYLKFLFLRLKKLKINPKIIIDIVEPPHTSETISAYFFHPFAIDSRLMFRKKILEQCDIAFFISKSLKNKYSKFFNKHFIVPSIINVCSKKNIQINTILDNINISYVGSLIQKDNPKKLINFIQGLISYRDDVNINIIGRSLYNTNSKMFREKLKNIQSKTNIKFYDNPSNDTLDLLMKKSHYICLFRDENSLQKDTFPTRLVQILNSNSVLITNLFGDIKYYFQDGLNCINYCEESFNYELLFDNNFYKKVNLESRKILDKQFNAENVISNVLKKI